MTPVARQRTSSRVITVTRPRRKRVVIVYIQRNEERRREGERERERVRESRQCWWWWGSTRTTLVARAGCRELATGYGHRMCHGVVAALILHPRTHVSRETYSWWDSRFTVTVRYARWAAGTRRLRWCIRGWLDATKCGSRAYFMCHNRWLCRAEVHGSGWCRGLSPNRETDAGTGRNRCPKLDQQYRGYAMLKNFSPTWCSSKKNAYEISIAAHIC